MIAADSVKITILVENWIDMLLAESDENHLCRCGLIEHFDQSATPPVAENGICFQVEVTSGGRTFSYLFDFGLTGKTLKHNADALGANPRAWQQLVLSHGHPDHYGGIYQALELSQRSIGVVTHPDAFLPRYALMGDGRVAPTYNSTLSIEKITKAGGTVVLSKDPVDIGPGVITTGEIPRSVPFEGPRLDAPLRTPGLYQVKDGVWGIDEVWDELALIINVRNRGLVVLTGCSHAGIVNTVQRAMDLTGVTQIALVAGGFHLGFPTTPSENISLTVEALRQFEPSLIMPSHCSGFSALVAMRDAFPGFIQYAVGTSLIIG